MRDMQKQMDNLNKQQQQPPPPTRPTAAPKQGEYIDYEEVK